MGPRYRAVLVGCGPRGRRHAHALLANAERFELAAVCDLDPIRCAALAGDLGVARTYSDADRMLGAERPDVLVFATPPALREALVDLGVRHGVKAIACEKPLARSLGEARRIVDRCAAARVHGVVCHQLRHGAHWRRVKEIVEGGGIGELRLVHATGRPSLLRVGTHLVDAMLWLAGGGPAEWVLGQAHGGGGFADDHPGPDHLTGVVELANGVRGLLEVGSLAPRHLPDADFWSDVAVTLVGSHGHARVVLGGGWEAVTARGARTAGGPDIAPQEARHLALLADWLDNPAVVHPASFAASYHGLEVLLGLALSSVERRRVALPIEDRGDDILQRLDGVLSRRRNPLAHRR
ncbi:MAG: Gfo/Idh/MocA family oxidoreductase [Candidatus Rokuibacteriota bacterium]